MESKAWNWEVVDDGYWRDVSHEFLPTILEWKAKKLSHVLDLGCGIGRHALFLARNGFKVDAFDLSETGLHVLSQEVEHHKLDITITIGDMLSLPYERNKFDCVVAFHSIYHTDYPGLEQVIAEILRVLKKDGELYVTFNSKESDAWTLFSKRKVDDYTLLKTEGPEIDVPHTYVVYEDVMTLLSTFTIEKVQQIFDYWKDRKHAHFFVKCKK